MENATPHRTLCINLDELEANNFFGDDQWTTVIRNLFQFHAIEAALSGGFAVEFTDWPAECPIEGDEKDRLLDQILQSTLNEFNATFPVVLKATLNKFNEHKKDEEEYPYQCECGATKDLENVGLDDKGNEHFECNKCGRKYMRKCCEEILEEK